MSRAGELLLKRNNENAIKKIADGLSCSEFISFEDIESLDFLPAKLSISHSRNTAPDSCIEITKNSELIRLWMRSCLSKSNIQNEALICLGDVNTPIWFILRFSDFEDAILELWGRSASKELLILSKENKELLVFCNEEYQYTFNII